MGSANFLKPFNTMDKAKHIELSRKGGIASGEARRRKRDAIRAKALERAADNMLFNDTMDLMVECARLLCEVNRDISK